MDAEHKKNQRGGTRLKKADEERVSAPKPKRTRKHKILFALYITITVVAALIVAGFIALQLISAPPDTESFLASTTRKPQTTTIINENGEEVEVEIPGLSADRKEQFYTFLVAGISGGNTDTILLGAYDVPNQKLSVMSIPRDTYVKWKGNTVLINSVYSRAGSGKGMEALKTVVGELTGVTPDYYVLAEWEAVGELVDAIGGVWFEVPFDMYCNDLSQGFKIDLDAGYQLLDGDKAMQLIRYRINSVGDTGRIDYSYGYSNGDLGRIETQQAFLKAVIEKCLQPSVLLPKLTEYIRIFQENVETDLTVSNMVYFGKSAVGGLDMENVEFTTLPNKSAGNGHLLPVAGEIVSVINESFNPYEEDIQRGELNLATSAPGTSGGGTSTASASPAPSGDGEEESEEDGEEDSEATGEEENTAEPENPEESEPPEGTGAETPEGNEETEPGADLPDSGNTGTEPEDAGAGGEAEETVVPPPPPEETE